MEKELFEKIANGRFSNFNIDMQIDVIVKQILNGRFVFKDEETFTVSQDDLCEMALFLIKKLPLRISVVSAKNTPEIVYDGAKTLFMLFLYINNIIPKEHIVNAKKAIAKFKKNDLTCFTEAKLSIYGESLTFKDFNEKGRNVLLDSYINITRFQYDSNKLTTSDINDIINIIKK